MRPTHHPRGPHEDEGSAQRNRRMDGYIILTQKLGACNHIASQVDDVSVISPRNLAARVSALTIPRFLFACLLGWRGYGHVPGCIPVGDVMHPVRS